MTNASLGQSCLLIVGGFLWVLMSCSFRGTLPLYPSWQGHSGEKAASQLDGSTNIFPSRNCVLGRLFARCTPQQNRSSPLLRYKGLITFDVLWVKQSGSFLANIHSDCFRAHCGVASALIGSHHLCLAPSRRPWQSALSFCPAEVKLLVTKHVLNRFSMWSFTMMRFWTVRTTTSNS